MTFSHWGDIASVAGFGLSIIGFSVTLWSVSRSKKAAQQAKEAVERARNAIFRSDTMVQLAAARQTMEEIKRLHREAAWRVLPDRYAALRDSLSSIRIATPNLPDKDKAVIQGAIEQFRTLEKKVERALAANQNPPNVPRLNEVVSLQIDSITEVLGIMRTGQNA